jgi:hypothetical protein
VPLAGRSVFALGQSHFPIQTKVFTGGGELSVRRLSGVQNVMNRETKRPKERAKDQEYRRLTLTSTDLPLCQFTGRGGPGGFIYPSPGGRNGGSIGNVSRVSPTQSVPSPHGHRSSEGFPLRSGQQGTRSSGFDPVFDIALVHEGQTQRHRVHETMAVAQLVEEAAGIFSLDSRVIVLMLFTATPATLDRARDLAGPPRVGPNSTVMVFAVGSIPAERNLELRAGERDPTRAAPGPRMHSKLLGTFKLPKFDGTPKAWKQWDRDFVRFLGLHQLQHVLLEGFEHLLPHPEAVASNKIVYFLVEEAVLPGTLASKYVRQAALWDGHGAYTLLYNGFFFSGPQTATVLMAELSNIRFQSGETGTAFCLRLIELLEDLEHIPGSAAVCLNDTQKLGYLLSAIRHEKDLGGVYVQLQTDQLRGKITFEQACQELHFRCEAIRADNLLDTKFRPAGRVLISSCPPSTYPFVHRV